MEERKDERSSLHLKAFFLTFAQYLCAVIYRRVNPVILKASVWLGAAFTTPAFTIGRSSTADSIWQLLSCQMSHCLKPKRQQLRSSFWKPPRALLVFKFSPRKRGSRLDEWDESGCQWNGGHLGYHDAAHARRLPSPRLHLTLGEEAARTSSFSLSAKRSYTCRCCL